MGARNTQRARSPSTASPCGFSALGRDHSGAAGIVNFSDMLTSCLKNGATASSQCENVGALDISKLTAVSFAAMRLEIGSWQFIAKTKDAVSATCCYTQRQLSWQLAEAGQKNKIELQWDDITSLRVTPMGPATELLEVDVQSAPALYQETSPAVWQRCHDFTGGEASCLRTQKVLFPANTVMNLLQDLVLREPRLAKLTTNHHSMAVAPGSAIYPGSVVGNTSYPSLPCLQTPASTVGVLPTFNASAAPQAAQLPLFPNMYSTFNPSKDQAEGLSRGSSIMSNLSCATAQPQLSSECLSSTNSEDSLLNGLTSSPCYQSSYTSGYMNPFQAPNSPTRMPVSSSLGNSALLEQTAAMMKAATAALQSLQSPPQLYHSPQRQQPTEPFTSGPTQQAQHPGYAPQAPAMHAMPVQTAPAHNFLSVQTAPSVSSIGMQALEELMMSDSSQDSSSFTDGSTLHSVQSAPASFYAQATQPWCLTQLSCPSQAASAQPQQEPAAQHSMGQAFENVTHAAQHDATPAAAGPAPAKMRALKRSVSDIPVFDCKAAAAAMAAREAAKAELAAVEATQAAEQEAELADLDLPLLDDCFLADMGSSDMDSDLTSGLCFGGFGDFEEACPGIDRSDSSSNLLADQALQLFAEQAPLAAPKRKGKQSKKLKARGGVNKASAQAPIIRT